MWTAAPLFAATLLAGPPLLAQAPPSAMPRLTRPAIAVPPPAVSDDAVSPRPALPGTAVRAAKPSWESLQAGSAAAGATMAAPLETSPRPAISAPSNFAPRQGRVPPRAAPVGSAFAAGSGLPPLRGSAPTAAPVQPSSASSSEFESSGVGRSAAEMGPSFLGELPAPTRGAGAGNAFSDAASSGRDGASRSVFAGASESLAASLSGGDQAAWDGGSAGGGGLVARVASDRRYFDSGDTDVWGREAPGRLLSEEAGWLDDDEEPGADKAKSIFTNAKNPYTQTLSGAPVLESGVWPNLPWGDGLLHWSGPTQQFWVPQRFDLGGNRTGGPKSSWTVQVKPVWSTDGPTLKHTTQISGRLTEVNSVRSANEWIFTSSTDYRYESSPWLVFGTVLEEFDQMEKLSLRSTLTSGMGYRVQGDMLNRYVIFRLGPTVNYERYYGPLREVWTPEMLTEVELKYVYQRLTLEHKTSYYPSLTQPEFRMVNNSGLLLPLDSRSMWSIRTGFLQNYNDRVAAGVRPWSYEASLSVVFQRTPAVAGASGSSASSGFR